MLDWVWRITQAPPVAEGSLAVTRDAISQMEQLAQLEEGFRVELDALWSRLDQGEVFDKRMAKQLNALLERLPEAAYVFGYDEVPLATWPEQVPPELAETRVQLQELLAKARNSFYTACRGIRSVKGKS